MINIDTDRFRFPKRIISTTPQHYVLSKYKRGKFIRKVNASSAQIILENKQPVPAASKARKITANEFLHGKPPSVSTMPPERKQENVPQKALLTSGLPIKPTSDFKTLNDQVLRLREQEKQRQEKLKTETEREHETKEPEDSGFEEIIKNVPKPEYKQDSDPSFNSPDDGKDNEGDSLSQDETAADDEAAKKQEPKEQENYLTMEKLRQMSDSTLKKMYFICTHKPVADQTKFEVKKTILKKYNGMPKEKKKILVEASLED